MNLHLATTPVELAQQIAAYLLQVSGEAVAARGRFTVAISGGSMPQLLGQAAAEAAADRINWPAWHVFWADERCVPVDAFGASVACSAGSPPPVRGTCPPASGG